MISVYSNSAVFQGKIRFSGKWLVALASFFSERNNRCWNVYY